MNKKGSITAGVLIPSLERLDANQAEFILSMRLGPDVVERVDELSAAGKRRDLSDEERRELDFNFDLGSVLTIMHSKARVALKRPASRGAGRRSA
jgi:hypothetical protein